MTPALKLRASCGRSPPHVISTLLSDVDDDRPAPLDIDTVDRRQVNESGFLRAGDHARTDAGLAQMACRNAGLFSASRVAFVAAARISSM
jgi:hypothetical protein